MARTKTYLYIYENKKQNSIYIGIAESMSRVWQPHNTDAEQLREAEDTYILQTIEPFSSREDALKAEAIAIHVASFAGRKVVNTLVDETVDTDSTSTTVTNRAGTSSTKVLGPAVLRRSGVVDGNALTNTVVVSIRPESMDDRPSPYGGIPAAGFSERARKWWSIASFRKPHLNRLLAVAKDSGGLILGEWEIDQTADFSGTVIPLKDPANDNFADGKGKRLINLTCNSGVVYSLDVKSL